MSERREDPATASLATLRSRLRDPPIAESQVVSKVMRGNARRDTSPELALRSELHRRGLRFRVDLPISLATARAVRPDIVFTRRRVAVFVDGCFWHGCPEHGRPPKRNISYWESKIEVNRRRDQRQCELLDRAGWSVIRVWEHDPATAAADSVEQLLRRLGSG